MHLVKFQEFAEKEKVLVAENPPVGGEKTQAYIFLPADLFVSLQENLGFVAAAAAVCRRHCILLFVPGL